MTYTYKLARRLARLRTGAALLLPILAAACSAGEPLPTEASIDTGADGPVALSPRAVVLEGSQGVLFRAFESLIPGSAQVTSIEWTTTGGRVDASGNYTSTSTGAFRVVGRRRGNPHNPPDTGVVVVVPPQPTLVGVEVTPSTATVGGGLQQQFEALGRQSDGTQVLIGVTWTATGGTIDAGGLYTAGRTAGTYRVIATHVTTGLADTAVVTVPPATLTSITMSPGSVSLGAGQGQQFSVTGRLSDGSITYSVPVAYSATGGSVSVTGYYTAGSTGGTFRVIATAQGGKADTSSVSITASAPPPGGLWLNEDFSRYTSDEHFRSNPYGWQVTAASWFNQQQIHIDKQVLFEGHQTLRYDWPGPGVKTNSAGEDYWAGCSTDPAIQASYKTPNVSEVWIEVAHRFATNFNTNATSSGGTCIGNTAGYKFLLMWRTAGDRFDLLNGLSGYNWWSAHPAVESQAIKTVCSGIGFNCQLGYGEGQSQFLPVIPGTFWDGKWHIYRAHIKMPNTMGEKTGVFELWIDGTLVKRVVNQDFIRYNGLWSNRLAGIALGSNSNSGTSHATNNWWGRLRVWTANPNW